MTQKTDNILPKSIGEIVIEPIVLSADQEDLCSRLDDLHMINGLKGKPSDMFRGALFVARTQLRNNPDWIAQAANSLRDIIYPFGNRESAYKSYGSVHSTKPRFAQEVGKVYGSLTELAHHGNCRGNSIDYTTHSPTDFQNLITDFERVMHNILLRQVDIHQEVDDFLSQDPQGLTVDEVK